MMLPMTMICRRRYTRADFRFSSITPPRLRASSSLIDDAMPDAAASFAMLFSDADVATHFTYLPRFV